MSTLPEKYYVQGSSLIQSDEPDAAFEDDPRGVLWCWEQPEPSAKYIIGLDPTEGVTGWSRGTRMEGDHKTDNAAIIVIKVDGMIRPVVGKDGKIERQDGKPKMRYVDVQVAEYAAPVDAVEAARIVNVIGRVYKGDADEEAELILETYPGPGMLTLQELLRLGYGNMWQWERIADGMAVQTETIGWHSNAQSQRALWLRQRRHIMSERLVIQSQWLLEEYSNAVIDPEKMRAKASYGSHDDRIQAVGMALWAGHKWTYDAEPTAAPVTQERHLDFQRFAPTFDDHISYKDFKENIFD